MARRPDDPNSASKVWLENAYDLATPQDNRAYYRDFAPAYDVEFADALGYCYPRIIAESYVSQADAGDAPIADIGCGTGLVGDALPNELVVDGFDISPEMLKSAEDKNRYRALYEVDITSPLSDFQGRYGAIVSAGTFTHGHLGPEPLLNLIDFGRTNALFVIGVNKAHFEAMGFAKLLVEMVSKKRITPPDISEAPIYDRAGHAHSKDTALVLTFRKRAEA